MIPAGEPKVLTLDHMTWVDDFEWASFVSTTSVFDYDVVLWNPAGSVPQSPSQSWMGESNGAAYLDPRTEYQVRTAIASREREFEGFLASGGLLIVIADQPLVFAVDDEHIGTVWAASPLEFPRAVPAAGQSLNFDRADRLGKLLATHQNRARYQLLFDDDARWKSFARPLRGAGSAGLIQTVEGGGAVVILPALDFAFDVESADASGQAFFDSRVRDQAAAKSFYLALIAACRGEAASAAPDWVNDVRSALEAELMGRRSALVDQIHPLQVLLQDVDRATETERASKALLYATADELEEACAEVLTLLGGRRLDSEIGRADLRYQFPQGTAVVEVKGVTKSAKESFAAQLEKWAAAEIQAGASSSSIKSILFVNHYRESPPAIRPEPFPDQMLPYATSRGHLLMSTVQLFQIRDRVQAGSLEIETAVEAMFSTSGVFTMPAVDEHS